MKIFGEEPDEIDEIKNKNINSKFVDMAQRVVEVLPPRQAESRRIFSALAPFSKITGVEVSEIVESLQTKGAPVVGTAAVTQPPSAAPVTQPPPRSTVDLMEVKQPVTSSTDPFIQPQPKASNTTTGTEQYSSPLTPRSNETPSQEPIKLVNKTIDLPSHTYEGMSVELSKLTQEIILYFQRNGFKVEFSRPTPDQFNIQAKKTGIARKVVGFRRSAKIIITGNPQKFQIKLTTEDKRT